MMERDNDYRKRVGSYGEELAAEWLQRHGYELIGRNLRNAGGEADIVMRDGQVIVFVEVKTRTGSERPAMAVDLRKQRRYINIAQIFMAESTQDMGCRFDVVEVTWEPGLQRPRINHLKGAFIAEGYV